MTAKEKDVFLSVLCLIKLSQLPKFVKNIP